MTLATLLGLLFAGLLLGLSLKRRRRRINTNGREQRQRVVQYFDCTWVSQWGPMNARISNLSPSGCYIDSRFSVPAVGETVSKRNRNVPGFNSIEMSPF